MEKIKRKSLLYKSGVEYADYSLNHVLGCSHGCKYPCYAFMMKKRTGQVSSYEDWCQPRLVENALELIKKDLIKHRGNIRNVEFCFATDPFMYLQPEIHSMTIQLIEAINKQNIPCSILTKFGIPQ
jgi:DNA repair photolyase